LWPYHELLDHVVKLPVAAETEYSANDPLEHMRITANQRLRATIARRAPLNPTSDLWRQLLQTGFPFIKVELLRKNPTEVLDIADWRSDADLSMIERDLQQCLYNHSP
jgi:hypothetical protein